MDPSQAAAEDGNTTVENESKKTIEQILRCYESDDSILVETIKCIPGSQDGDNYMSVVKRLTVSGTHDKNQNQNDIYQRSLIVKRQIANLARRQLFRCDQAFSSEIIAYTQVVPKFRQFCSSIRLKIPFVDCLYAGVDELGDLIVLDDLKPFGYRMAKRLKGLDYNHCKIVLQELAILHGVSLAAKRLYSAEFEAVVESIPESIYCAEAAEFFTHSLESSLKEALFSLRKSNENRNGDADLSSAIEQVEKLTGQLYNVMCRCVRNGNPDWMVICHGDLWINNLMFKYDGHGVVDGVKFIDLQTLRYTSPVIDILHFLYTSTEYAIREQHMEQLLDDYVESLYATLQQFEVYDGSVCSLGEIIRQEMRDQSMYGLGICMWLMPAVTFHPDNIPDLDAVTMNDFTSSNQEKTMTQMQTPEYHVRMLETVMEFYRKGILNDIT